VTLPTSYLGVFSNQLVRDNVVVEIATIGVHPIMTGPAGSTKVLCVHLHEGGVNLSMTNGTYRLVKVGIALGMAVTANERSVINLNFVGSQ